MRDLDTKKQNSWCAGCGNFGILSAFKAAVNKLVDEGLNPDELVITCGIGCHGKIFDYLAVSGIFGLHGRALATAQGIKLANPALTVISFGGDGDSLGEGLEHTLFAAKRNMDLTLILHNNGNYGLTTGQFSPLSKTGFRGLSTPRGSIERPYQPIPLLMEAGATFVARAYSAKTEHLSGLIQSAVRHKGFSFIEVMQPCVSYNNTYQLLNQKIKLLDTIPSSRNHSLELARNEEEIYIGVFHQEELPVYHEAFYGSANPRQQRIPAAQRRKQASEN